VNASYTALSSEIEFRTALDTVLPRVSRELLIFDRDLVSLKLDDAHRIDLITGVLTQNRNCRIRIVVHNPLPAQQSAPRLINLLARFSHAIACRQSPENLLYLADSHVIADDACGVRRFQSGQPRSALILNDANYLLPWRQRFEELWEVSSQCLSPDTTGL
jgi:hypothetical protein